MAGFDFVASIVGEAISYTLSHLLGSVFRRKYTFSHASAHALGERVIIVILGIALIALTVHYS